MSSISIRNATEGDRSSVFALAQAFATSFAVEWSAFDDSFSQILVSDDARLLVATQGDMVIGYCLAFDHQTFFANGRVTWVEEIAVSEHTRRSGAGRRLMGGIEQWADERRSRMVALSTRRAADFYTAIGYEESAAYFRKLLLGA